MIRARSCTSADVGVRLSVWCVQEQASLGASVSESVDMVKQVLALLQAQVCDSQVFGDADTHKP